MNQSAIGSDIEIRFEDPFATESSPGEDFARAVAAINNNEDITVPFHSYLPAAFPLLRTRPRYMVRHLFKMGTVRPDNGQYLEERTEKVEGASGTRFNATLESGFVAITREAGFSAVEMSLSMPTEFVTNPGPFATFIDYRMLIRMWTYENEILLYGSRDGQITGLLNHDIRRRSISGGVLKSLMTAASEVEETGGSCDGIVVHPETYWSAAESGLLDRLRSAGITVSRTRMMPKSSALLGDCRAGATVLNPNDSTIALRRDPNNDAHKIIETRTRLGLAVHVPQHFLLIDGEA